MTDDREREREMSSDEIQEIDGIPIINAQHKPVKVGDIQFHRNRDGIKQGIKIIRISATNGCLMFYGSLEPENYGHLSQSVYATSCYDSAAAIPDHFVCQHNTLELPDCEMCVDGHCRDLLLCHLNDGDYFIQSVLGNDNVYRLVSKFNRAYGCYTVEDTVTGEIDGMLDFTSVIKVDKPETDDTD
jgi:hypothetical protein